MTVTNLAAMTRRALACFVVCLALGGCSLPGASSPTPTPLPTATAAPATATATAAPAASAAPLTPTIIATVTATATATRTPAPATPATPNARPATPATPAATPLAAGQTIGDERQVCELTLPADYKPAGGPGHYASADGRVLVALQSLTAGQDDTLDDLALPFVGAFIPTVTGYEQTAVIRLADSLRIDFRGGLPRSGGGTLYFRQFGPNVCVVTFFVADGAGVDADALFETVIATLRPKGVG